MQKAQNDKGLAPCNPLGRYAQNDNALVILSDSEVSIQKTESIAEFMDFSLVSLTQNDNG